MLHEITVYEPEVKPQRPLLRPTRKIQVDERCLNSDINFLCCCASRCASHSGQPAWWLSRARKSYEKLPGCSELYSKQGDASTVRERAHVKYCELFSRLGNEVSGTCGSSQVLCVAATQISAAPDLVLSSCCVTAPSVIYLFFYF